MNLKPIHDHIIFKFVEDTTRVKGQQSFAEKTDWGFDISPGSQSYDSSAKEARWGIVVAVGHEVEEDIYPGLAILIEPLKWTSGFVYEGNRMWQTNSSQVIATAKNAPNRY